MHIVLILYQQLWEVFLECNQVIILVNIFISLVCEILPQESILGFCYFWRVITLEI